MPSGKLDLLWRFLAQNEGKLSQRARAKEFAALTDIEVSQIENMFEEAGLDSTAAEIESPSIEARPPS
jgi:hypothetical protein